MKIHLVVNMSGIVMNQVQVEKQKKIFSSLVKIVRNKKYKVEKILKKRYDKGKAKVFG